METENDQIERIDKFLFEEMSEKERTEFLQDLEQDGSLKSLYESQRDIQKGIEHASLQDLKRHLQTTEASVNKNGMAWGMIWKVAAAISLLAIISYLIISGLGPSEQELYLAYYSPYPNVIDPVDRSANNGTSEEMMAYEQGDYQAAALLFTNKLNGRPGNDTLNFYIGQSRLALGENNEAIEAFKAVGASSAFGEPAAWYHALALLNSGQSAEAKNQLQQIANSESSYAQRAEELLSKF